VSIQRSTASFAAKGSSEGTASVPESVRLAQAWLPVTERSVAFESGAVRYIDATRHSIQDGFLDFWERSGGDAYLGNPLTEEYTLNGVTYQVFERGQLVLESSGDVYMTPVGRMLAEKYGLDKEPVPQGHIPTYSEALFIPPPPTPEIEVVGAGPGPVPGASKSLVVSIGEQRMWAYEDETVVLSSLVSTGKPGFDTPTGLFSISKKVEIQDMEGLIGGEYYNVTDVPDVMYFTTVGHAFHGAYWHDNFGAVMSHGCINLPLDVAQFLYEWTPMYTPVLIVA
ncbi:MAG: L,D-transpeptidase, partial [Chloroflexota bacterium]|nr:L,D-transpeptidase [Chloroflexota bacterium]